jgi:hypothetical protein
MKLSKILIAATALAAVSASAQTTTIDFGSTFVASDPFPALYFANDAGTRYDTGNDAVLAVGYFSDIGSNVSFSDYLSDFTMLGFESFVGNQSAPGYLTAATSTSLDVSSQTPFLLVLAGISDYSNAASATSFAVVGDSGWSYLAPATPPSPSNLLTTIAPDNVVVGSLNTVSDGNQVNNVAVPEPAHYAALLGALGLALVMWRRRR